MMFIDAGPTILLSDDRRASIGHGLASEGHHNLLSDSGAHAIQLHTLRMSKARAAS